MVVALLGLMAGACSSGDSGDEAAPRVPVGVATVVRDTMSEQVTLVGRLAPVPGGSAVLTADADAVVEQVLVQIGSPVESGAPLMRLNAPELTARVTELNAAAAVATSSAARQSELFVQGITSRKDADEAAAAATSAQSAAAAAQQLLARTRVTSPIAGAVQRVLVQQGERVAAGQPLVEVIDSRELDLQAQAPAALLGSLRVGQDAQVTAEGSTDALPARLIAIAPAVDSLSNAASVMIRVGNRAHRLHAGTGATAVVRVGRAREALIVPADALVLVGGTMSVFVVGADSVARVRPVSVEMRRDGRAAVTGPLAPGDVVVSVGAYGLSDSTRVVPSTPAAP